MHKRVIFTFNLFLFIDLFERKGYVDDAEFDWTGRTMSTPVRSLSHKVLITIFQCSGSEPGPDITEWPGAGQTQHGDGQGWRQGDTSLEREQTKWY